VKPLYVRRLAGRDAHGEAVISGVCSGCRGGGLTGLSARQKCHGRRDRHAQYGDQPKHRAPKLAVGDNITR
jgi:hypothetical protein